MKKYVNGKIVEMTETDIEKRKARISNRPNARKNAPDQEQRIKELEATVATLLTKLNESEQ